MPPNILLTNTELLLNKIGKELVDQIVEELLETKFKNTGYSFANSRFINSINHLVEAFTRTQIELTIEHPAYGIWIEKGRKPNSTPPPIDAIRAWIARRALPHNPWAVRASVAKKGILPTPFTHIFIEALADIEEIFQRQFFFIIENELDKMFEELKK